VIGNNKGVNMFNLVQWYKFDVNGRTALVPALSVLAACTILENEGYTNYSYQGIVD